MLPRNRGEKGNTMEIAEMIERVSTPNGCDQMAALLAHPVGFVKAALDNGMNLLNWDLHTKPGMLLFVCVEDHTRPLPPAIMSVLEAEHNAFRLTQTEGRALLGRSYHDAEARRRRDQIESDYNGAARAAREALEAAGLEHLLWGRDTSGYITMRDTVLRNNTDRVPMAGILVVNAPEGEREAYASKIPDDTAYPVTVIMQPRAVVAV
jgi:hypothetical protein